MSWNKIFWYHRTVRGVIKQTHRRKYRVCREMWLLRLKVTKRIDGVTTGPYTHIHRRSQ